MQLFSGYRVAAFALLLGGMVVSGCAQTVLIRTDRPGVELTIDDEPKGPIPSEGVFVSIGAGFEDVPYSLSEEGVTVERGLIEREVRWLPLVTALATAAITVPFCALTCFGVANPLICVAPIWAALGTAAGFSAVASTPGWLSLPFAFGGTVVGLSPLGFLLCTERTPTVLRVGVTEEGRERRRMMDEDDGAGNDGREQAQHASSAAWAMAF